MAVIAADEVIETPNQIYTYVLKVEYINHPTENQNIDQGKKFSFKVNLRPESTYTNPYSEGTLAFQIFNDISYGTLDNKSIYVPNLDATNMSNTVTTETDKIFSSAKDDYGTSYYFRGNVEDNYVNFANMCWRIVRIQGDGSTKLILASELPCSETNLSDSSGYATDGESGVVGNLMKSYMGYNLSNEIYRFDYVKATSNNENNVRTALNSWIDKKISASDKKMLKEDKWCIGDLSNAYDNGIAIGKSDNLIASSTQFYYISGDKLNLNLKPSYKCVTSGVEGEIDFNYVGLINFDELIFSGVLGTSKSSISYLTSNSNENKWFTLSLYKYASNEKKDNYYVIGKSGNSKGLGVSSDYAKFFYLRPVVTLKSGVIFDEGKGTVNEPYTVKLLNEEEIVQTIKFSFNSEEEYEVAPGTTFSKFIEESGTEKFWIDETSGIINYGTSKTYTWNCVSPTGIKATGEAIIENGDYECGPIIDIG